MSTGFQCFAIAFNGLVNKQKDLLGMIGVNNVDRYCGNSLSCITNTAFPDGKQGTVTSTMGSPFIISFYVNNTDHIYFTRALDHVSERFNFQPSNRIFSPAFRATIMRVPTTGTLGSRSCTGSCRARCR